MPKNEYATLESQLGDEICGAEDTEEMFWLREADDYDSMVALGNALAGQYRFREAIDIYNRASGIRSDESLLFIRIAGANLTLFRFEEAKANYDRALEKGAAPVSVAFYMGILNYLRGDYTASRECFENSLPTESGEMKIAIIYWHTLACYRGNHECTLLSEYSSDMDVGHHLAYKRVVDIFCSKRENVADDLNNPLDKAIFIYGMSVYYEYRDEIIKSKEYLNRVLENNEVWPCVSYLAAWNDVNHH